MSEGYNLRSIYRAGAISVIVPTLALIAALLSGSILFLDYVHVLLGAIWTGVDVFYGLIFYFVISTIGDESRKNIGIRLIPMSLFFIPTASILVPLVGYILATKEGIFSLSSTVIDAAIIIGSILVVEGFLTIVLSSAIILRNITKNNSDTKKVSRLVMIGSHGALVQMILQIAIISVMAYIVVYI